ncbi:SpoIIE family protein phosphatase [Aquipuribacter nitratireducens]|uniref:SpoIIE family protein phosphatase n=1 Tax=Aquipuribacter nitratireducens TaxID=650104 RepID=A0ABW0GV02_9MICO
MRGPLLEATGALRPAYEQVDWAASPLGPPRDWAPELRSTLYVALTTRFAATLLWGPEYVLVYNEAYAELIGEKHPAALGRPAQEVFPEIWDDIEPLLDGVMETGVATFPLDMRLDMVRNGALDEGYFTYCYSPVAAPDGTVLGILDIALETTGHVVDRRRLDVLGRLGIALADVDDAGELVAVTSDLLGKAVDDLPKVDVVLGGAAEVAATSWHGATPPAHVGLEDVVVADGPEGRVAWLALPVQGPRARRPLLAVLLNPLAAEDEAYRDFLVLVARAIGAAVDRVNAHEQERSEAAATRAMSEALQRSMLTDPPDLAPLDVAVRYLPARNDSRVGGDWYDAFRLPDDDACLVIGDVAGHDQRAAAVMGQVRNVLRGVAQSVGTPPSRVLGALDRAMDQLGVAAMSSALVLVAGRGGEHSSLGPLDGSTPVVFSSAGHLPPLLLSPDGTARLLWTDADLMLGVDPRAERHDTRVDLAPGATLLLFTDGLVERRDVGLEQGLERLREAAADLHHLGLEALCDAVLTQVGGAPEDDLALLAVRRRTG